MKIIITGSLGNISKALTQMLVEQDHTVTVISSKQERKKGIEELGAIAAIGTMEDVNFLTQTFTGADIVYCMEASGYELLFDKNFDFMDAMTNVGNNYKQAIQQSGVKKVIHLSSTGAHTGKGIGLLASHYNVENILQQLPDDVIIKTMRPGGFYSNVLAFIPTIKSAGAIIQNYGGDKKQPWVSPMDIASVIAEEMELSFTERKIRYIASDELSPNEMARILGEAIGKADLKWVSIPDEQMLNNMIAAGMNPAFAKGMIEMNAARINGVLYEDYFRNRPTLSNTKFNEYAKEFAVVYNNSNQ